MPSAHSVLYTLIVTNLSGPFLSTSFSLEEQSRGVINAAGLLYNVTICVVIHMDIYVHIAIYMYVCGYI